MDIDAVKEENVMWTSPLQPNGIITGYQVFYSVYEDNSDMMSELLDNDTYEYSIDGLSKINVNNSMWAYSMCIAT